MVPKIDAPAPLFEPSSNTDLWEHFRRPRAHFGLLLAPFGSLLAPFGPLLAPFGAILAPFGSLLAPFGSLLAYFWRLLAHFYCLLVTFFIFSMYFRCKCRAKPYFYIIPIRFSIFMLFCKPLHITHHRVHPNLNRPGGGTIAAGNRIRPRAACARRGVVN